MLRCLELYGNRLRVFRARSGQNGGSFIDFNTVALTTGQTTVLPAIAIQRKYDMLTSYKRPRRDSDRQRLKTWLFSKSFPP